MAGKVFFSVTMSLDGFMAPDAVPVEYVFSPEGQNDPRVQRWMTKWSELQAWLFPQRWFRENLKLGEGGELAWPEEAPFQTPVVVVTHEKRKVTRQRPARVWLTDSGGLADLWGLVARTTRSGNHGRIVVVP